MENIDTIPERIQRVLEGLLGDDLHGLLGVARTGYKPNATIPYLWIAISEGQIVLCSTHRTRGLFRLYDRSNLNSVRVEASSTGGETTLNMLSAEMAEPDLRVPLSDSVDSDEIRALIERAGFEVL